MAIATTSLHIFRVLHQIVTNLVQLQRDINKNANVWLTQANAQSVPLTTLTAGIAATIVQYQTRLGWISTIMSDATNFPPAQAMYAILGGTAADVNSLFTSLNNIVTTMAGTPLPSYAAVVTGSNNVIAAVPAPISLWPE